MRSPLPLPFRVVLAVFSLGMVAISAAWGEFDSSRISVAGTVSLDGKPLESGTIRFICPLTRNRSMWTSAWWRTANTPSPDSESLVPGTYQVQIRSYAQEAVPRAIKANADEIPPDQRILVPARYNVQSVLQVKIHTAA